MIKSFFQAIDSVDLSPQSFTHIFKKIVAHHEVKLHVKSASFSTDNGQTSRLSIFYCISKHKHFIPKYLDNALTDFHLNFTNI